MFRQHHYLNTSIHSGSQCFVALFRNNPVAFTAVLHFPHPRCLNTKREHRTVCLPDYQGVGIGNVMSDTVASCFKALGSRYLSLTSHPAMVLSRIGSKNWSMICRSTYKTKSMAGSSFKSAPGQRGAIRCRLMSSFEYIGPKMDLAVANDLIGGEKFSA